MTSRARRILAGVALTFVVACGGTTSRPSWLVSHHLGAPHGLRPVGIPGSGAQDTVLRSGTNQLEVVTWGSSGCPRLPVQLVTSTPNAVSVTMSDGESPDGAACTADLAPTTSVIRVPSTLDLGQPINVKIIDGVFGISAALPPPQGVSG